MDMDCPKCFERIDVGGQEHYRRSLGIDPVVRLSRLKETEAMYHNIKIIFDYTKLDFKALSNSILSDK
jgi:hypothetical protein